MREIGRGEGTLVESSLQMEMKINIGLEGNEDEHRFELILHDSNIWFDFEGVQKEENRAIGSRKGDCGAMVREVC